jgi:hypothetical protein
MPIVKEEWNSGNSDVAGFWLFQNAIENLVKQGMAETKEIRQNTGNKVYYRAILLQK